MFDYLQQLEDRARQNPGGAEMTVNAGFDQGEYLVHLRDKTYPMRGLRATSPRY